MKIDKIEAISIKNFKCLRDVTLRQLPDFCVIIGANGTGKTTLFNIFGFLRDCLKDNVSHAVQKYGGGFKGVVSHGHENENIEIEIKFRMRLKQKDDTEKNRTVTYHLSIGERRGRPIVAREFLRYRRGPHGKPFHFLEFVDGSGEAVTNELEFFEDVDLKREHQDLVSSDILAIKGLGQFGKFPAASAFRNLIENWHLSDFHIQAARTLQDAGYADHLSSQGENLALVTQFLYENHRNDFDGILKKMRRRVPGIDRVEAQHTEDGRILLRFQDGAFKDPFSARYVSDGTIKMFAYLVLLHDPAPHPLLCVEEPENQLYHDLLRELAEEFDDYARRGGQVFVSTHSPDFLNSVLLENVFCLVKKNGFSSIHHVQNDAQLIDLAKEGDPSGELWKQGLFKGAHPA